MIGTRWVMGFLVLVIMISPSIVFGFNYDMTPAVSQLNYEQGPIVSYNMSVMQKEGAVKSADCEVPTKPAAKPVVRAAPKPVYRTYSQPRRLFRW
jgi:hypothetical protein